MRTESNYRKGKDKNFKELIEKENEKLGGLILKRPIKENKTSIESTIDFRAILKQRATITKRDWGGHCFEYCDKEIAHSGKVDDLTQEQAETICGILKIPLTEETINQIPKGNFCPCGCGEMLRKGARFRQGHDTRLRCQLIKKYKRTKSNVVLKELRKWDWEKYLG